MKRNLWIFLLSGVLVATAFFSTFYALSLPTSSPKSVTVVLDAGHGGIDCGVVGLSTGVKESEINLSLVKKMEEIFKDSAVNVVLTRKTEAGLYGVMGKGMKKRDMAKRKQIIEKSSPAAVVSVHQNSYPADRDQQGSQVFFFPSDEKSRELALAVQKQLNAVNPFRRDKQIHSGDYYLLTCSKAPSVIVECGFLTNEQEEALLCTDEYQKTIAESVVRGVLSFLAVQTGK